MTLRFPLAFRQVFPRSLALFFLACFLNGATIAQVQPNASYRNEVIKMHFPSRTDVLVDLEQFDKKRMSPIKLVSEDIQAGSQFLRQALPGNYTVTVFFIIEADGTVKSAKALSAGSRPLEQTCRAMILSSVYSPAIYDEKAIPIVAVRDCNYMIEATK